MYKDYYLDVKNVADKIRQNPSEKPLPNRENGFMRRPDEQEEEKPNSFEQVLLQYMTGVRNSSTTARYEDSLPAEAKGGLQQAMNAIGKIESGGNYQAVGPTITKGSYKGDRAYGKYQVMGKNIPQWSREVLGKELTVEEFMANPRYQDMIAGAKLSQAMSKYGSWEDAASVWFSGQPLAKAGNRSDGYNTVPEYVSKFNKAWEEVNLA